MTTYTDEIEKRANDLLEQTLMDLYIHEGLKIRIQEHYKEKGIDFTLEIETRELSPKTIGFVSLQNKGSEKKVKPLKKGPNKGLISYQIEDIRLIDYWCHQIDRPFIFIFCDLESKTIYWNALQLQSDQYLDRATKFSELQKEGKRKGKSIQIYLDPQNTLLFNGAPCYSLFSRFMLDIEESLKLLSHRSSLIFDYERIDRIAEIKVNRTSHILNQLNEYLNARFKYIKVLPHSFWALSYPFKTGIGQYFEYDLFTLFTDNELLIQLFSTFSVENNREIKIQNSEFFDGVEDVQEKLLNILRILNKNLVFSISHSVKQEIINIRIHEEELGDEGEYAFFNLRFDKVLEVLKSQPETEVDIERLAFLNYEVGNYAQAARLYLKLLGTHRNVGKSSKYFFYAYNLSKIEFFLRSHFFSEQADKELLKRLKEVKTAFENSANLFEEDVRITKWLKQRLFFWEYQSDISSSVESLREFYFLLQNGGLGSNSFIWSIYVDHALLLSFIDGNKIVCDFEHAFNSLNALVAEAFFMSYSIDESIASRLDQFDDWHIKFLIFNCKPEDIRKYINRYHIKSIKYARNSSAKDGFMDLVSNFFSSASCLNKWTGWENSWKFTDKYRNIFGNLLLLSSYLELNQNEYNSIGLSVRNYFRVQSGTSLAFQLRYLNQFILNKGVWFTDQLVNDYFKLFVENPDFHKEDFLVALSYVSEKGTVKLSLDSNDFEKAVNFFADTCPFCFGPHEPTMLVYLHLLLSENEQKLYIKRLIESKLQSEYSWRLYYMAAIHDILPVASQYFDKLIDLQTSSKGAYNFEAHYFKNKRNRDARLGAIINLCLKFGIDLKEQRFQRFKGFDPYYDWLLDMENFDYVNFNPRWITEYATTFYSKEMSKVEKIIAETIKYLDGRYDQLVVWNLLIVLKRRLLE